MLRNNFNSTKEDIMKKNTEKNKLVLDLQKLRAEKEKAEKTYTDMMREKLNSKVIMESQKRLLNR